VSTAALQRTSEQELREQLSNLQGLLALSMLMTESGDEAQILHLVVSEQLLLADRARLQRPRHPGEIADDADHLYRERFLRDAYGLHVDVDVDVGAAPLGSAEEPVHLTDIVDAELVED